MHQAFEGASDLDIPAATQGKAVQVARVFCARATRVSGALAFNVQDFSAGTTLTLSLRGPSGAELARRVFRRGDSGERLETDATERGFHTFTLEAHAVQSENHRLGFILIVSYQAPKT